MRARFSPLAVRASGRFVAAASLGAVLVLLVSSAVAFKYWTADYANSNTISVYARYADGVMDGKVPFRDFRVEYPPGALPIFVLPLADPQARHASFTTPLNLAAHRYYRGFALITIAIMAGTICLTALSLLRLGRSRAHVLIALSLLALSSVALGGVVYTNYDAWPAALVAAALVAALAGWIKTAGAALGIGIAAKLYPLVLLPLLITFAWRRWGARRALVVLAVAVVATLTVVLPFAVMSPSGVEAALRSQLERKLQIESLGSAVLLGLSQAGVTFGSVPLYRHELAGVAKGTNLAGSGTDAAVAVLGAIRIATLVGIWFFFARGPATFDRFVRYAAAAVAATVAFSPVLSPQFLVWLLPVVPLVGGRRGLAAAAVLLCGIAVTHVWWPYTYFEFVSDFTTSGALLLLARDLVLVALLVLLLVRADLLPRALRSANSREC